MFGRRAMAEGAVKDWKLECEAIHKEMNCLVRAPWPETAAERQARRVQFMALIERRDVATRNILQTGGDRMPPTSLTKALDLALAERSEAANAADRAPEVPPGSNPTPQTMSRSDSPPHQSPVGAGQIADIKILSILLSFEP